MKKVQFEQLGTKSGFTRDRAEPDQTKVQAFLASAEAFGVFNDKAVYFTIVTAPNIVI